ncbi:FYN-binding protein 1-like isoform X2 [Watersipora subatra]|uniref:FYN-binding protein 1-like isoform X2 n=1 Tax=Watersipora subatra TaxID=2589382 RepID=UPI00355B6F2B
MGDEEIYDEAEAGITEKTTRPMVILNSSSNPVKKANPSPFGETKGLSVKERLAQLQARNNESTPSKPYVPKKPTSVNNNNAGSPETKKPFVPTKPTNSTSPNSAIAAAIAKRSPAFNPNEIKSRKQSLKIVNRTGDEPTNDGTEAVKKEVEIVCTKDKKKFQKLPFAKKPGKPTKPVSLDNPSLPIVQFTDVKTGVDQRIGAGRTSNESFKIQSMTEEDEMDEGSETAPSLPVAPHPSSLAVKRGLPPAPPKPAAADSPMIEELYGEAEVDTSIVEEGQELYEEFDEARPPPPARNPTPPQPPVAIVSPETTQKTSKAEKEKEKKEKLKQEKIAKEKEKQRIKETKERETIMKKYKLSEEDLVTSHYIQAKNAASGGKMMIAVKAKEKLQLIRKTGCPEGKWIARNPYSDAVGLVDASNMIDLEAAPVTQAVSAPAEAIDEEIYEELN